MSALLVCLPAAPASAQVVVPPGASIQAAINASEPGHTILHASAYNRMQELYPKDGQTFVGQPGAILSGARLLTGWVQSGSAWYVDGQTQQGSQVGFLSGVCLPGVWCLYPEDLFIDDQWLFHTNSLAEGGPGRWFFDYAADRIYVWDDPTGRRVETSVTPRAFTGYANNVTIQQLVVEKFATPVQTAAIQGTGRRWRIDRTEVRWNHAIGVSLGEERVIIWSNIHHNGQLGLGGSGDYNLVEANDIAYNNAVGFDPNLEAGGAKFTHSDHLTVRGNYVHHNRGPGLHSDEGNYNVLYEHNRSEYNSQSGIQHEIGYDAVIRYNYLRGNGTSKPYPYWVDGAGIQIATSWNVQVYGNTLENNWQGIQALDQPRGSGRYGVYSLSNLMVHDNLIDSSVPLGIGSGRTGIAGSNPATWSSKNNSFYANTYRLGPYQDYFTWIGDEFTEHEWRAHFGQDQTGTFSR